MRIALACAVLSAAACVLPEQALSTSVPLSTTGGGSDGTCTMSEAKTMNLTDLPEFAKYKNDIAKAQLTGARLRVTHVTQGNAATHAGGTATLTAPDGSTATLHTESELNIAAGDSAELAFDPDEVQAVVDAALKDPYTVVVQADAHADGGPCLFSFDVELDFAVTPTWGALVE